jgi:hypothetical protein
VRNGRFWIEFQPLQGKPNSHAWNTDRSFRSNRLPFIPGRGTIPPQATAGSYAHPMCRTHVYSATVWSYSRLLCRMYSHTSVHVNKQLKSSGGGRVHFPGWLVTRLTAYHISRHVASTFKRLTATTTHCDLNQIHQHRRGIIPFHDTACNPVHHPYSDCRIVSNQ